MTKTFDIAVVGATGTVGEAMLSILAERHFPVGNIYALASERSIEKTVMFKDRPILVENLATFDFSKVQIALFSAGGKVSAEFAPQATAAGCIVIDNTSHFRNDHDVPLVITEVNPHAIAYYEQCNIIANPNCSTMQMLVALKPLYDAVGITRINVTTYQSVSGAGRQAISELVGQTANLLNGKAIKKSKSFAKQIAFNVIPQIGEMLENGYTQEEMKFVSETHKILEDENILINPTCVRVPVFYGHSEAIEIETREKISAAHAKQILKQAPGIIVVDKQTPGGYPTPVTEGAGHDAVYVGRIRESIACDYGLNLWVVSDNIRKGAALNAVQIAEILVKDYL